MQRARAILPVGVRAALGAAASVATAFAVLVGCDTRGDGDLWGDAMSPTQEQRADLGPGATPNYFTTTQGDSDDPYVDNPNYPFVQGPWWQNPAYNGG